MKKLLLVLVVLMASVTTDAKIDRYALVQRNNPHITEIDTMASLSVGNGEFAFTCDVTGLQTLHRLYSKGVPLGTMAQWGWHSFPNTHGYKAEDALKAYDFGRGSEEWYSCQLKDEFGKAASDYLRANPHRLHLGIVAFKGMEAKDIADIDQTLDMWTGTITSNYRCQNMPMRVVTTCDAERDMIVANISDGAKHGVQILLPYPTGVHSDDACDWSEGKSHSVGQVDLARETAVFRHTLDGQPYYIKLCWKNAFAPNIEKGAICITPKGKNWTLSVEFCKDIPNDKAVNFKQSAAGTERYWKDYWTLGGAVDFSHCTDERAAELERRVVLSQYLLAIQCAGSTPPQETGLTYNSWFGKYHLEMIWWHMAHFALWGHADMLERTLPWYESALGEAQKIAKRQGFRGARWMKMTDPSAAEAPSNVGSFLIWQQPHIIYLCELLYRAKKDDAIIERYAGLIDETAEFMASFATYDKENDRYILKGCIPAQETLKASETINPPFELSYWHFALSIAQEWRVRQGKERNAEWDKVIRMLSPLSEKDGVYAAAESAASYPSLKTMESNGDNGPFEASELPDNVKFYSDHMAVLAACGVLPFSPQYNKEAMTRTLKWVMQNWNWNKTWGWDYPTTCMNAVRTGNPETAIEAILMDKRTNTYLPNGHNYQDGRLRCYLPGNGGLLTAVALMCAGWDGNETPLPGFPKDGKWEVEYEGIERMP